MKFKYTILYVENVTETITFFEKAFGLQQAMIHESGDYGELQTGSTSLSFSSLKLMRDLGKNPSPANASSPTFEIAFETEDVKGALKRAVNAGATLAQDVEQMPWGQTTAYVTELNGFLVEICSPVEYQQ